MATLKLLRGKNPNSGEEGYSLLGPNGEEGDLFDYGELATVMANDGTIYYALANDATDEVDVFKVVNAVKVECLYEDEELSDEDEEGDEEEEESEVEE